MFSFNLTVLLLCYTQPMLIEYLVTLVSFALGRL